MIQQSSEQTAIRLPQGFGFGGYIPRTLNTQDTPPDRAQVPPEMLGTAEEFMFLALVESMRGVGHTIPNPSVGCVLVQDDQILALGATEAFGGRHAERVAFDLLKSRHISSAGLDAFVTLEPCSHHGRQPPCCELFKDAGIRNLFIAMNDPNPMVQGRGLSFAERYVKSLNVGLLRSAATAWHLPFLTQHSLGRPLVVAKWAQTLDGAFADKSGVSQWITGPQARAHGHWLRLKYDVTAIGLTTLLTDQPSLTVRDCWRPNERQPHVCIVDATGEARADDVILRSGLEKILSASSQRKVALVTTQENLPLLQGKIPETITLLGLPAMSATITPSMRAQIIAEFWSSDSMNSWLGRAPQSIFIEGGAQLISALLEIDAIDLLHIFIAPMILGGDARRLTRLENQAPALSSAAHFDILSTFSLGSDIVLELMPHRMVDAFFSKG